MASTDVLPITAIDVGQSEAVWPLSIEAGWNQNVADWRFMLGAGLDIPISKHFGLRLLRADYVFSNHQYEPEALAFQPLGQCGRLRGDGRNVGAGPRRAPTTGWRE